MKRINVIQSIIDRKKKVNYLEIGVFTGRVFLRVKAKNKVAVDPDFKIPKAWKIKYGIRNPSNWGSKYFEVTSDDFFEKQTIILHRFSVLLTMMVRDNC